jgi:RNA polymerase sigma factor (sigma-70 family)
MSSAPRSGPAGDRAGEVVAHARFVRALAGELLRDAGEADELAARTMAEAIARRPAAGPSLRAWLRRVVWRLFRREQRDVERRVRRELGAARAEAQAATVDLVAQMELQRRIVEAFATLDEPFKSALFRRYFHDETPTRIAQETGVPLATVKSRLQRALAQMRARLDAAHEGRREEWLAALVPWISFGGPIVATKGKLAAAAVALAVLAGAGAVVVETNRRERRVEETPSAAAPAVAEKFVARPGADREKAATLARREEIGKAAPGSDEAPSLIELRELLASTRRLDQVRAIELLLAQGNDDSIRTLLDVFLTTGDPLLVALIEDGVAKSTLDLAPRLVDEFRATSDPQKLGRLTRMLTGLLATRPEVGPKVVQLFIGALEDASREGHDGANAEDEKALVAALVALGPCALDPLAKYLADPASGRRGAGAAAAALAQLDASQGGAVRDAAKAGVESMRRLLEDGSRTPDEKDAARDRTGSLVWALGNRPATEHDDLAGDLVQSLLATTDSAQAGTLAWGIANLKGLSAEARLRTFRSILDSVAVPSVGAFRQTYAWAASQIVRSAYEGRPLDADFDRLVDAATSALNSCREDSPAAKQYQWLLAELRGLQPKNP